MQKPYYKLMLPRLTLGEMWRISPNILVFVILAFMKLFRMNVTPMHALARMDEVNLIDWDQLPPEFEVVLGKSRAEYEQLGFSGMLLLRSDLIGSREAYVMFFVHEDRSTVVDVTYSISEENGIETKELTTILVSQFANGEMLLTSDGKLPNLKRPVILKLVKSATPEQLLNHHRERLREMAAAPVSIASASDLTGMVVKIEHELFDQMVARKLFGAIDSEEFKRIQAVGRFSRVVSRPENLASDENTGRGDAPAPAPPIKAPPINAPPINAPIPSAADMGPASHESAISPGAPASASYVLTGSLTQREPSQPDALSDLDYLGEMHQDDIVVLKQIHSKHGQSTNWVSKLLLLFISLVAFVGIGAWLWSWWVVLILIPILFVHELGHYVAMKALKYQDVKMFFLPLFGAAVHGRNYNAPGWQRAVVALAGPIPSLLLGCGIMAVTDDRMWLAFGAATVVLNALNLLPFLPLDGGWVMQTTLFCRNHFLDFVFRILAVLAMALIGLFLGGRVLIGLAVFMAFGLPLQWKLGRLTHQLKKDGIQPEPTSYDELCEPTIYEIVKRLREDSLVPLPQRANTALNIYELLSAKPPGVLLSLGLLLVQGVALFGSIGFTLWIFMSLFPQGRGLDIDTPKLPEPTQLISSNEIQVPGKEMDKTPPGSSLAIYVVCRDPREVQTATTLLAGHPEVQVAQLGNYLVAEFLEDVDGPTIDQLSQKLLDEKLLTYSSADGNVAFNFSFRLTDPDKKEAVILAMQRYLGLLEYEPAPPWQPGFRWEEKESARATARDLIDFPIEFDDSLFELDQKISDAFEGGDQNQIRELRRERTRAYHLIEKKQITDALRKNRDWDSKVVEAWLAYSLESQEAMLEFEPPDDDTETLPASYLELQRLLGTLPDVEADPRRLDFSLVDGYTTAEGDLVKLNAVVFHRPATGIARLVDWLEKNDAKLIQFVIYDQNLMFQEFQERLMERLND